MQISIRLIKKHLKGFTLTEIIISMVISGTLLALAIKAILTIVSISTHQNETSSHNNKILTIQTILRENFIIASRIETGLPDELKFIYADNSFTNISFGSSGLIIKNKLSPDTIKVSLDSLHIEKSDSDTLLVKKIYFVMKYNSISYPVYFRKDYDNQILYSISIYKNAD